MTQTKYMRFQGLQHSIALQDADLLAPIIADVMAAWPQQADTLSSSFATISPHPKHGWQIALSDSTDAPKYWDDVNVICDLVAEMAWERLRSDPTLLSLHAAAIDFQGRCVVIPNARRAGKSMLAVALAKLGHDLLSDDYVPVRVDPDSGVISGVANGVAPRLRLPVPQEFSTNFQDWVAADRGPANNQYKYMCDCPVLPGGTSRPLGAIVILDRQETPCHPALEAVPQAEALSSLISQNFARTVHAATILQTLDLLTSHLPAYRLRYHSGEEAASYLSVHPALQALPMACQRGATPCANQVDVSQTEQPMFNPAHKFMQAPHVTEVDAGTDHFLADQAGTAIHRLNPSSVVIWRLLSEPVDQAELVALMAAVYPETDPDQIFADTESMLRTFLNAGLVTAAASAVELT